jgi:FkbM family methyltransferase
MLKTLKGRLALLIPDVVFWRTVQGLEVAHSTRNSPWAYSPRNMGEAIESEGIGEILRTMKPGVFWDAGCNLGYYSLYAAKLGWEVYSWDLGQRAVELLNMSAQRNHLKVVANQTAFTDRPVRYREMDSAYAGSKVTFDPNGSLSMTWKDAAAKYPAPSFLKMDIEGAEIDFLKDAEFRQWITDKGIVLAMEIHHPSSRYYLAKWGKGVYFNTHLFVLPQTQ